MIWSAGDLGLEIDLGSNQPGAILQRKESDGYQDFLVKNRHLIAIYKKYPIVKLTLANFFPM